MPLILDRFIKIITVFSISLLLSACAAALLIPGADKMIAGAAEGIANGLTNTHIDIKVDPDDSCGSQRIALGESRNYFLKSIISGALVGAATGVVIGLLTGGAGKAIAQAAAGGALVGGITGAVQANQQEIAGAQSLQASLGSEVLSEYKEIDKASQSFIRLRDCRFSAARTVKSSYRAKRITHDQAQQKLTRLNTLFDEDIVMAEDIGVKMSERAKTYAEKSDELVRNDPVARKDYTKWVAKQDQPAKATSKSSRAKVSKPDKRKVAKGDALSVAQTTHSNVLKQVNFTNLVADSKPMASKAFSLEGNISTDFPALPRNFFIHSC